tara:strand:+ start:1568 stop:2053 length:486 start_codon:yes stop_codon:yes gene_type:complete
MNLQESLTQLDLDETSVVSFSFEEGTDVFHFNETHVETALEETTVVDKLAEAITSGLEVATEYGHNPLEHLRDSELLNGYQRGTGQFAEFVSSVIKENFWDADLISENTKHYDHKRGWTTLSTTLTAPVKTVLNNSTGYSTAFSGWTAQVNTNGGTFSFTV